MQKCQQKEETAVFLICVYSFRESYRENGKVKHKTIANLTHISKDFIENLKFLLKQEKSKEPFTTDIISNITQKESFGTVYVVYTLLKRLGVVEVLESLKDEKQSKLALWHIIARAIEHDCILNSVMLAKTNCACSVVQIKESFNEDDLYENLKWLSKIQSQAEKRLFKLSHDSNNELFLYDITSSYLEGQYNAFALYGYNRDKKEGKKTNSCWTAL
ncbi:hypothetical protein [Desulfurella sp.]|uniref:hypothetical protein n=1 Tax=Desulfurella sp. TaxID=1962857 RepID=UPI003D0E9A49